MFRRSGRWLRSLRYGRFLPSPLLLPPLPPEEEAGGPGAAVWEPGECPAWKRRPDLSTFLTLPQRPDLLAHQSVLPLPPKLSMHAPSGTRFACPLRPHSAPLTCAIRCVCPCAATPVPVRLHGAHAIVPACRARPLRALVTSSPLSPLRCFVERIALVFCCAPVRDRLLLQGDAGSFKSVTETENLSLTRLTPGALDEPPLPLRDPRRLRRMPGAPATPRVTRPTSLPILSHQLLFSRIVSVFCRSACVSAAGVRPLLRAHRRLRGRAPAPPPPQPQGRSRPQGGAPGTGAGRARVVAAARGRLAAGARAAAAATPRRPLLMRRSASHTGATAVPPLSRVPFFTHNESLFSLRPSEVVGTAPTSTNHQGTYRVELAATLPDGTECFALSADDFDSHIPVTAGASADAAAAAAEAAEDGRAAGRGLCGRAKGGAAALSAAGRKLIVERSTALPFANAPAGALHPVLRCPCLVCSFSLPCPHTVQLCKKRFRLRSASPPQFQVATRQAISASVPHHIVRCVRHRDA